MIKKMSVIFGMMLRQFRNFSTMCDNKYGDPNSVLKVLVLLALSLPKVNAKTCVVFHGHPPWINRLLKVDFS